MAGENGSRRWRKKASKLGCAKAHDTKWVFTLYDIGPPGGGRSMATKSWGPRRPLAGRILTMLARFLTLNVFMTASNKTESQGPSLVTHTLVHVTIPDGQLNSCLDQTTASSPNIRSFSGTIRHWDPCLNPSLSCSCLLTQSLLEKCAGFAIAEEARVLLHGRARPAQMRHTA